MMHGWDVMHLQDRRHLACVRVCVITIDVMPQIDREGLRDDMVHLRADQRHSTGSEFAVGCMGLRRHLE